LDAHEAKYTRGEKEEESCKWDEEQGDKWTTRDGVVTHVVRVGEVKEDSVLFRCRANPLPELQSVWERHWGEIEAAEQPKPSESSEPSRTSSEGTWEDGSWCAVL
jgi:hypothetical protein